MKAYHAAVWALVAVLGPCSSPRAGALSFEDRVRAQAAIAGLYAKHRVGATTDEGVPEFVARDQVRDYLRQSALLEQYWSIPVTAEMLDAEASRIARQSRMPGRLLELYAALGGDPVVIRECLIRPVLVSRLVQWRFASDPRVHSDELAVLTAIRERLSNGSLRPSDEHAFRSIEEWSKASGASCWNRPRSESGREQGCVASLPTGAEEVRSIEEGTAGFEVLVLSSADETSAVVVRYGVPKVDWSHWWWKHAGGFDESSVATVADSSPLPVPGDTLQSGGMSLSATDGTVCHDYWDNGSLDDVPNGRPNPTVIWTGDVAVFWGGNIGTGAQNTGGQYDPMAAVWRRKTSLLGAPEGRGGHTAVWTGTEMIVWGGSTLRALQTGGRYNPVTDVWRPVTTINAPVGRSEHVAVWTGSRMIVWGGADEWNTLQNDGARYDPYADAWSGLSTVGAPEARKGATAAWTGTQMLVWGGLGSSVILGTGGTYTPASDTWSSMSTSGSPSPRYAHTAVWGGSRMIIWGGADSTTSTWQALSTGAQYDPVSNRWSKMSQSGQPTSRAWHTAVWSGTEMIVWGGDDEHNNLFNTGARYSPATNRWQSTSTTNAPTGRSAHAAVFGAGKMLLWAGTDDSTGGCYDPVSDSWVPTSLAGAPDARFAESGIWDGTHMVIWGGYGAGNVLFNSGSRYDPSLDAWFPTTTIGAPPPRYNHRAVWTGTSMIVWGGRSGPDTLLNTGGRYDPFADFWTPISALGAPSGRESHSAVWTGSGMIVWGGIDTAANRNTGGIYSPASNTWTPTATAGAPSARSRHTAVWSGSRMIVWGAASDPYGTLDSSGGRYDPSTNTWQPTTLIGAPSGRMNHSAIWTGDRMIVWGGFGANSYWRSGGVYDPVADSWSPTNLLGAPSGRDSHAAVWTGRRLIIWGGYAPQGDGQNGGVYDPAQDAWSATTMVDAPDDHLFPDAVWTGVEMVIWGGGRVGGGRYVPDETPVPGGSSVLSVAKLPDVTLSWTSLLGASVYDVTKGGLGVLRQSNGDYSSATQLCLADDNSSLSIQDFTVPVEGDGFWYLVRGVSCGGPGTDDDGSASLYRSRDPGLAASASSCP